MSHQPEHTSTLSPYLTVDGAEKAIALWEKALGVQSMGILKCPKTGKVAHACLKIGDTTLFMGDPQEGCSPINTQGARFYIYVEDAEKTFAQALAAGFTEIQPVAPQFWGDRMGVSTDPYGVTWVIATHEHMVSPEEMTKVMEAM